MGIYAAILENIGEPHGEEHGKRNGHLGPCKWVVEIYRGLQGLGDNGGFHGKTGKCAPESGAMWQLHGD